MKQAPGIKEMNGPFLAIVTDNHAGILRMTPSWFC